MSHPRLRRRHGTGEPRWFRTWHPEETIAVFGGLLGVMAGAAAVVRGDTAYALTAILSGLALVGLVLWRRRTAPQRIAANRRRRESLIGPPQLWTDGELLTMRTSDDVDLLHRVAERARDRRTEECKRWFVSHFFTHGPDWVLSIDGGEPAPLGLQRYSDLVARIPPHGILRVTEKALLVEVSTMPAWRRAAGRERRHPPEETWELRPAHCCCVMPGWRTDEPIPAPPGYL